MATTTNMSLSLPTVSTTLGPEWAELLNAALAIIDAHDHSTGKGIKITQEGLEITDDLDLQNSDLQNADTVGLKNNSSAQTSKLGTLQRIGTNLWWVNSSGSAVQITSGSSVNSSGTGKLSVDAPASYPHTVTTGDSETVLTVDTNSARTINLPAATNLIYVIIKDKDNLAATNNITVVPDGTDTIDGSNSDYIINTSGAAVGFISDGVSSWYII